MFGVPREKTGVQFFRSHEFWLSLSVALSALSVGAAEPEWVKPLPLPMPGVYQGTADVKALPAGGPGGVAAVEWAFPATKPPQLTLDLPGAGIEVSGYDEIACDFQVEGSDATPTWTLFEWPRPKTLSNWYAKTPRPLGQWVSWACDLRLDDDGVQLSSGYAAGKGETFERPTFRFALSPLFLRFPGEPDWRRVRVANLRLTRWPVRIEIDKRQAVCSVTDQEVVTSYPVTLTSRLERPGTCVVKAQTAKATFHTVRFAESAAPELRVPLQPGEKKVVTLEFRLGRTQAEKLPPLFAESALLEARMEEVPAVTVRPLLGYRPLLVWGAVPVWNFHRPDPAETMAEMKEKAKLYPWIPAAVERNVTSARALLSRDFPVLTDGPLGYGQSYICRDCNVRPKMIEPHRHQCPKCGKEFTDDATFRNWLPYHHGENLDAAVKLSQAWQFTGEPAFARKAADIFLAYAAAYDKIVSPEPRSTCSQAKLGMNTLMEAFLVPPSFQAYHRIAAAPVLSADERQRIERNYLLASANRVMCHGAILNQRAENFRVFGYGGLFCRNWAMAGEAVYGPDGWLALSEDGFSADGIAQEGGGYHAGQMGAMAEFAETFLDQGVNLYNLRWKRVFDGTMGSGPTGVAATCVAAYEEAYRQYRDPAYLPTLQKLRQGESWASVERGVIGLPACEPTVGTASDLTGAGLLFLRGNTSAGHRCLAINYGMQWDRTELDRLHFRFFVDGQPASAKVGRITYGSPFSHLMYQSFAHNVVTVDRQNLIEKRVEKIGAVEKPGLSAVLFRATGENALYPGVTQYRLVAIVGPHFFVADRLEGDKPREFGWHFYPAGETQEFALPLTAGEGPLADLWAEPMPANSTGPWRQGRSAEPLRVRYPADAKTKTPPLTLVLRTDGQADITDGSLMRGYYPKMLPFTRVVRRDTATATCAALFLTTTPEPAAPAATLQPLPTPPGVYAWTITSGETRVTLGINTTGKPVTGVPSLANSADALLTTTDR